MDDLLKKLGQKIKFYQFSKEESVTTVARYIDVDRAYLSRIENGHERPSEKLLNDLISHFNLSSNEANELFVLAGYKSGAVAAQSSKGEKPMTNEFKLPVEGQQRQLQFNKPIGLSTLYSDSVVIKSNQWGIVFDFGQSASQDQTNIVSSIGMSREHARALLDALKKNLETVPDQGKVGSLN
jgi:transcriptional regulator with XRE-family HTH domain